MTSNSRKVSIFSSLCLLFDKTVSISLFLILISLFLPSFTIHRDSNVEENKKLKLNYDRINCMRLRETYESKTEKFEDLKSSREQHHKGNEHAFDLKRKTNK